MIAIGTHHKVGTVLLFNIFEAVRKQQGLKLFYGEQVDLQNDVDIFFNDHSVIDPEKLPENFKGIHIVRHPYETIVSGYRYHLKTDESWCRDEVRDEFGGKTYQALLKSLPADEGIMFEMMQVGYLTVRDMYGWNYDDKRFLNIRLEDFLEDFDATLEGMFRFLTFEDAQIGALVRRCQQYKKGKDRSTHITNRSNAVYTYQNYFKPQHYLLFEKLFPADTLQKLGYDEAARSQGVR